jgi:tetratricopeptide (TPR) repeat protein
MSRIRTQRLAIALVALLPLATLACINMYGTNVQGERVDADVCSHDLPEYIADPQRVEWIAEALARAEKAVRDDPSPEQRNDLAAALLHAGEFQRGHDLLVALEAEDPGRYPVAANLGTALELLGRDEEARHWIAAGIERNARNHFGTEWIHLRILDAKLALARDPSWLQRHAVLGIDFGVADAPAKDYPLPPDNLGKPNTEARWVQMGVCHQLRERLPFTPKPDAIVASLLFETGNIAFHHDTLENALKFYRLAQAYGVPDPALLARRIARTEALLKQLAPKEPAMHSR